MTSDKRKADQRVASAKVRAATQTKLDKLIQMVEELLKKQGNSMLITERDYKRQLMVIEELANQVNKLKDLYLKIAAERDELKGRLRIY